MKRNVRNLVSTLLLVAAIVVTQIPVSDVEAEDNVSTSDFQMNGSTLVKYNGTAENVSLSDAVKKIESDAFFGNEYVKNVTIGDSVEEIGARAFSQCTNLKSVTIPDSVLRIENAAFSGCANLQKVSVGSGLTSLGNGAFAGCYSLEKVDFSGDNAKFTCDDGAIYNKDANAALGKASKDTLYQVLAGRKGDSFAVPTSVKTIKPYALWGCYNLEQVEVGSNVKEIPGYAFSNCKNLKNVDIAYSVNTLDMKSFENCVRLRDITIPESVSYIHPTAFDGCTKLTIHADPGSYAKTFADSLVLEDIEVSDHEDPPGVIKDNEESVSGNDSGEGEKITAPVDYYHEVAHINAMEEEENDSVKGKSRVIGQEAYVLVSNSQASVNVGSTGEVLGGSPDEDIEQIMDTVPGLEGSEDAKGGSFPKYSVVDDRLIAAQAYYGDEMTSYTIPDGIEKIGDFAFARTGLTSITIPDGVEEIGYAAFYHSDGLTNVVIPNSVQEIEPYAFDKTGWMNNWEQSGSSDFLIVGDGILLAYKGTASEVTVPDNVRMIGAEVFQGSRTIHKVTIPDSVKVIGEGAFEDCNNLSEIEGGNQVKEIRDRAFAGCPLTDIRIPASVETIGLRAFDVSTALSSGEDCVVTFEGENLPTLSYEESATKLYRDTYRDLAFKGVSKVLIPDAVKDISGSVLSLSQYGYRGEIAKKAKDTTAESAGSDEDESAEDSAAEQSSAEVSAEDSGSTEGAAQTSDTDNTLKDSKAMTVSTTPGIEVEVNSYSIPEEGTVSAVFGDTDGDDEGKSGSYLLHIEDNEDAKTAISDAYKEIYGNKLPHNLCAYEIDMTDVNTGIPIKSLGQNSVQVTIPVPGTVSEDRLHVVCLDEDGQLEEVESSYISSDGIDAITFNARHFSYYGVYNFGSASDQSVADVKDGQAVFTSIGKKDDSPDTGDHSIHPKWFFGAGLLFASLAVFFYRPIRKKRVLTKTEENDDKPGNI
jgi:hypothetical protein